MLLDKDVNTRIYIQLSFFTKWLKINWNHLGTYRGVIIYKRYQVNNKSYVKQQFQKHNVLPPYSLEAVGITRVGTKWRAINCGVVHDYTPRDPRILRKESDHIIAWLLIGAHDDVISLTCIRGDQTEVLLFDIDGINGDQRHGVIGDVGTVALGIPGDTDHPNSVALSRDDVKGGVRIICSTIAPHSVNVTQVLYGVTLLQAPADPLAVDVASLPFGFKLSLGSC